MNFIANKKSWRFINQSTTIQQQSPLISFAIDDTLCEMVGQLHSSPVIRTWVHHASVVLGIQDHRLPFIQEGMNFLTQSGYEPIVRNSGGLAVVLDEGVLNLSLIMSEQDEKMSINDGYDRMLELIQALFPEAEEKIKAYEIIGSYCPGTYDLSIDGKKFAGISQRRIRKGVAVQIYLCVEGSGAKRAELIREFYTKSLQQVETKFQYPAIKPEVMASLSELLQMDLTVADVVERVRQVFTKHTDIVEREQLNEEELDKFDFYNHRIIERNKKMLYEN